MIEHGVLYWVCTDRALYMLYIPYQLALQPFVGLGLLHQQPPDNKIGSGSYINVISQFIISLSGIRLVYHIRGRAVGFWTELFCTMGLSVLCVTPYQEHRGFSVGDPYPQPLLYPLELRGSSCGFGLPRIFYFPRTLHLYRWWAFPYPPPGEAPDGRPSAPHGIFYLYIHLITILQAGMSRVRFPMRSLNF
jgi:hypothetical protein